MKAMARDGRTIDVRRRWLPWKPRLRDVDSSGGDAGGFDLGDDLAGVAVVIAIFLLLLFFPVVLAAAYGDRFAPPAYLVELARTGGRFPA